MIPNLDKIKKRWFFDYHLKHKQRLLSRERKCCMHCWVRNKAIACFLDQQKCSQPNCGSLSRGKKMEYFGKVLASNMAKSAIYPETPSQGGRKTRHHYWSEHPVYRFWLLKVFSWESYLAQYEGMICTIKIILIWNRLSWSQPSHFIRSSQSQLFAVSYQEP